MKITARTASARRGPAPTGAIMALILVAVPLGMATVASADEGVEASTSDAVPASEPVPGHTLTVSQAVNGFCTGTAALDKTQGGGIVAGYIDITAFTHPDNPPHASQTFYEGGPDYISVSIQIPLREEPLLVKTDINRYSDGEAASWIEDYTVTCQESSDPQPPVWSGTVDRIGGPNRYHTASMLAGVWGVPGQTCVNIAQGRNEHVIDSITGGMMAAAGMTITSSGVNCSSTVNLHVRDEGIPSATATRLNELQPPSITVLGGESAVSEQLREQLGDYTDGPVDRISGSNRYGTAAEIARSAVAGGMDASTVLLANGQGIDLANALAASGLNRHPVLLVRQDSVPRATAEALAEFNPSHIVVVGNRGSVSDSVAAAAGATARIDGANHEEVSVNLMNTYLENAPEVFIVRDDVFADGLAVSVLPGPAVTVHGDVASDQFIQALGAMDTVKATIAGGYQAVSYAYQVSLEEARQE